MKKCDVVIGVDPGVTGGISILEKDNSPHVVRIPIQKIEVNKRNKNVYDISSIVEIFRQYSTKSVLFCQEKVGVMPQEGSVSSFSFGRSVGITEGIAIAFNFVFITVRPPVWKSYFPQLKTNVIVSFKEDLKYLKIFGKTIKEEKGKKENKKEIRKINAQIKKEAKNAARELASMFYPELADNFVQKNSDGMAESLLIAKWASENHYMTTIIGDNNGMV